MVIIKTFENTAKFCKCLICNTKYENGPRIISMPFCKCGNLQFDITPNYVRILIKNCFLKHSTGEDWQEEVLHEIEAIGTPKNALEFSDLSKEEQKQFPSFKFPEDFDIFAIK